MHFGVLVPVWCLPKMGLFLAADFTTASGLEPQLLGMYIGRGEPFDLFEVPKTSSYVQGATVRPLSLRDTAISVCLQQALFTNHQRLTCCI
ncbi:hypothetical protein K458DRAFT_424539 [Lentithecium fluviatile CBS 122367]|uniref:Secreted protein n=1 Tax=Lentithecium fluviatile CBS 122367 TaxID=1168545 RepID=A0A6G1IF04_9PLEO|nr:hypothetical protein K458DRAFT_424539 [Lentithecium fluviatile CBS 122367]